jgi:hypothetical protein
MGKGMLPTPLEVPEIAEKPEVEEGVGASERSDACDGTASLEVGVDGDLELEMRLEVDLMEDGTGEWVIGRRSEKGESNIRGDRDRECLSPNSHSRNCAS